MTTTTHAHAPPHAAMPREPMWRKAATQIQLFVSVAAACITLGVLLGRPVYLAYQRLDNHQYRLESMEKTSDKLDQVRLDTAGIKAQINAEHDILADMNAQLRELRARK